MPYICGWPIMNTGLGSSHAGEGRSGGEGVRADIVAVLCFLPLNVARRSRG
jgi:hypothetical protein